MKYSNMKIKFVDDTGPTVKKPRTIMKKADIEREISALAGTKIEVTSKIERGCSKASCIIGEWEYEGEARSIDFAYRALLMKIRDERSSGYIS